MAFLAGCYAPDTSGTCTDMNGVVSWSDGSKYVTQGAMAGLYGPGDTAPCIAVVNVPNGIKGTKGSEVLTYTADTSTQIGTITCPDGTTVTASFDQVGAFNRCAGLDCP